MPRVAFKQGATGLEQLTLRCQIILLSPNWHFPLLIFHRQFSYLLFGLLFPSSYHMELMKTGFKSCIIISSTRTLCLKNPECQIHPLSSSTLLIRYSERLERSCLPQSQSCLPDRTGSPGTFQVTLNMQDTHERESVCVLASLNVFVSQNT